MKHALNSILIYGTDILEHGVATSIDTTIYAVIEMIQLLKQNPLKFNILYN